MDTWKRMWSDPGEDPGGPPFVLTNGAIIACLHQLSDVISDCCNQVKLLCSSKGATPSIVKGMLPSERPHFERV